MDVLWKSQHLIRLDVIEAAFAVPEFDGPGECKVHLHERVELGMILAHGVGDWEINGSNVSQALFSLAGAKHFRRQYFCKIGLRQSTPISLAW